MMHTVGIGMTPRFGISLEDASAQELETALAKIRGAHHMTTITQTMGSPVGTWNVSTVADWDGGKSDLGTYTGHIADIAAMLRPHGDKGHYPLEFSPVKLYQAAQKCTNKTSIDITLDVQSGTWNLKPEERIAAITAWLHTVPSKFFKTLNVQNGQNGTHSVQLNVEA